MKSEYKAAKGTWGYYDPTTQQNVVQGTFHAEWDEEAQRYINVMDEFGNCSVKLEPKPKRMIRPDV